MKLLALCHHPSTKKRWSPENLVSVLLIACHCEGKAFSWELSKIPFKCLLLQRFSMVEGCVCVCVRVCVFACIHVRRAEREKCEGAIYMVTFCKHSLCFSPSGENSIQASWLPCCWGVVDVKPKKSTNIPDPGLTCHRHYLGSSTKQLERWW